MGRSRHRHFLALTLALVAASGSGAHAQDDEDLAPYKMLRSLQFVQDSVVMGDHSATEMQRFMLGRIDERLRSADRSIFEDDRNTDAALVYAMSGGNPATLDYLAAHDVNGYFDNRVTDVLRKYLSGKGLLIAKTLAETAREYRGKKIGPYLSLVGGNIMVAKDPKEALALYDAARLDAPGTIVEEAALRRSLAICLDLGLVEKGLGYAERYARRFLHSPYASQFADLFVKLVVDHNPEVGEKDIVDILDFMDEPRRREVYLRIARAAAISGKRDLGAMAAARAQALSAGDTDNAFGALADFYGGMAAIPTDKVSAAAKDIGSIADDRLSVRDQALRAAASAVAEQVLRPPQAASPAQASASSDDPQEISSAQPAAPAAGSPPASVPPATTQVSTDRTPKAETAVAPPQDADKSFTEFVTKGRSKLEEIDGLLTKESN